MNNTLRSILSQSIVWALTLAYFTILRQFGQDLVDEPEPITIYEYVLIYFSTGLLFSIVFVSIDKLVTKKLKSIQSFGAVILLRSLLSLIIFIILIVIGSIIYMLPNWATFSTEIITNYLFSKEGALILSYLFLVSFIIQFIKQIDRKFGSGNLFRMLKGEFHRPKEVERIVMFLDLKSSTSIAEQIGHIKYSRLLQECFNQLTMTKDFEAEIYQYVGDEVVIVWETKKGLKSSNILKFYYAYKNVLMNRADYYKSTYGVFPEFKCGCHIGKVVMTEIGQVKREIAYHGDVMNTAARIQSQCNKLNREFLMSKELYHLLVNDKAFKFEFMSDDILKGKKSQVKIYSVTDN